MIQSFAKQHYEKAHVRNPSYGKLALTHMINNITAPAIRRSDLK